MEWLTSPGIVHRSLGEQGAYTGSMNGLMASEVTLSSEVSATVATALQKARGSSLPFFK